MFLVKPSFEILTPEKQIQSALIFVEMAGRICYKSESKGDWEATKKFVSNLIKRGHESVIEHFNITVKIICDRGVTHEIVRHRLVSYSQESTRYCNYSGGVTFVIPEWLEFWIIPGEFNEHSLRPNNNLANCWWAAMLDSERRYLNLLKLGWNPQQARSVLPNSLKTEIVCTANLREWRHIFKLRTSSTAHPQMREIMIPMLQEFKRLIPIIYDDINYL